MNELGVSPHNSNIEKDSMIEEGHATDLRTRESYGRTDRRRERDPRSSGEKMVKENATQTSEYPARTGVGDSYYYLKNGRCGFGLSCRFNHPPVQEIVDNIYKLGGVAIDLSADSTILMHR
ncbi:hypothetical protein Rs2_21962 [Raphanus sativus]|nr:hypothetical protein Rs2_21960 [Raphanus sativus]KAJ4895168.1 hypothetical protein Rs2_21962 [Raphanus sativus]